MTNQITPSLNAQLIGAHSETDIQGNNAEFKLAFEPWATAKDWSGEDVKKFALLRDNWKVGKIAALLYSPLDYGNTAEIADKMAKGRSVLEMTKRKGKRGPEEHKAYGTAAVAFGRALQRAGYVTPITQGAVKKTEDAKATRDLAKEEEAKQEKLTERKTREAAIKAGVEKALAKEVSKDVTTPAAFLNVLHVERQYLAQLVNKARDKATPDMLQLVATFIKGIDDLKL